MSTALKVLGFGSHPFEFTEEVMQWVSLSGHPCLDNAPNNSALWLGNVYNYLSNLPISQ